MNFNFEKYIEEFSNTINLQDFVVNIIVGTILAMSLSWFYVRYGHAVSNRRRFSANFVPLALATMLIITIVKSSIALSLGLVGALSIVRFRAAIKDPEELTYLFLVIGVGLSTGANQPILAILATSVILSLIRLYQYLSNDSVLFKREDRLYLNISTDIGDLEKITNTITQVLPYVELKRLDTIKTGLDLAYICKAESIGQIATLKDKLKELSEETTVSIIDPTGSDHMIVKNTEIKGFKIPVWFWKWSLLFVAFILLFLVGKYFWPKAGSETAATVLCDAEKVKGQYFVTGNFQSTGILGQSKDFAYEGKYSCKVDAKKNAYAFGMSYPVKKGEKIAISVWRKKASASSVGFLVMMEEVDKPSLYLQTQKKVEVGENGWERLEISHTFFEDPPKGVVKIFAMAATDVCYFDQLYIHKEQINWTETWQPKGVRMVFKQSDWTKIKEKRKEALGIGVLISEEDDWVNASLVDGDQKMAVKTRLKGDWLDHLQGEKWSFRIKMKGFEAWNRLRVFSFQNPSTRNHLKEWVLHQWFHKEDVLSPRYDFINLMVNNNSLGIYAYEEHFVKQLPEYHLRREGPIVRFVEDGIWEARQLAKTNFTGLENRYEERYLADEIKPFSEGKTQASSSLSAQFKLARSLMYQYKMGVKKVSKVFNLDLLAKYYAIIDVMGAHHGVIWHNQRFYYNPVLSKLEPIGYDGFDDTGQTWMTWPFFGYYRCNPKGEASLENSIFRDHEFMRKYTFYLQKFADPAYLRSLFTKLDEPLKSRALLIQSEYPDYKFQTQEILKRADQIRFVLLQAEDGLSVKIYLQNLKAGKKRLAMKNNLPLPVEIIAWGEKEGYPDVQLDSSLILDSYRSTDIGEYRFLDLPESAKFIFFKVLGLEKIQVVPILNWPIPELSTVVQKLFEGIKLESNTYYDVFDKKLVFRPGKHEIREDIRIPEGYQVQINSGTTLHFYNKAKFISYSPIFIYGTKEAPVLIESPDKTAAGFTVLQVKEKSLLNHVIFKDFNTLHHEGWQLTGAVTFYESDVDLLYCVFSSNHCEDALNIVRSNFLLQKSVISNTYADGLDADFCKGKVMDSRFENTGNDAIDFSTSHIHVQDCKMHAIGDKGISAGEESTVLVENTKIEGAIIGVAAKDFSVLTIKSINLKDCQTGFAAYQKKPEYGGAKILVEKYTGENIKHLHEIAPGSKLVLEGREIL